MKKLLSILCLLAMCLVSACSSSSSEPVRIADSITLNSTKADMSGYVYLKDKDPAFDEITLPESIRLFEEKGSGVLYYGRTGCPWCQRAVVLLDEAAQDLGVRVYYVDLGKPIAESQEESMKQYNLLLEYIGDVFEKDVDGNPNFQIPEVIAVKDGVITDHHLSLLDSFVLSDNEQQMSSAQKNELRQIYEDLIRSCAEEDHAE